MRRKLSLDRLPTTGRNRYTQHPYRTMAFISPGLAHRRSQLLSYRRIIKCSTTPPDEPVTSTASPSSGDDANVAKRSDEKGSNNEREYSEAEVARMRKMHAIMWTNRKVRSTT